MHSNKVDNSPQATAGKWVGALPLLLVAIGTVVYANSLSGPFIFDDAAIIVENSSIRQLWPPLWLAKAWAHTNLGVALVDQGDIATAIGHYRCGLELDPGDPVTHNNLGFALAIQGTLDEAIATTAGR